MEQSQQPVVAVSEYLDSASLKEQGFRSLEDKDLVGTKVSTEMAAKCLVNDKYRTSGISILLVEGKDVSIFVYLDGIYGWVIFHDSVRKDIKLFADIIETLDCMNEFIQLERQSESWQLDTYRQRVLKDIKTAYHNFQESHGLKEVMYDYFPEFNISDHVPRNRMPINKYF